MSVIKSFIIITLFTILQNIGAQDNIEAVQYIDHPQKNEYILLSPGTDKHKYGYELKENKHFHHTTTELDGVRLGCYGYVLEGKKYSTQYVADIKGYRPVYTYNVINVYPKSGGVREATFIGNFKEDKDKSENIRYFFPEGCRGDDINIIPAEKNPMPPPIRKQPLPPTNPPPTNPPPTTPRPTTPRPTTPAPTTPAPPPSTPRRTTEKSVPVINTVRLVPETTTTKKPIPPPEKYLPPPNTYLPPVVTPAPALKGNYITKELPPITQPKVIPTTPKPAPKADPKPTPKPTPKVEPKATPKPAPPKADPKPTPKPVEPKPTPAIFKTPIVVAPIPEAPKNTCEAKCCNDDDAIPKLVIPINLGAAKSGSCPRYAKLTVPADSVGMESLKTLLSNPSELAKTIIKSLS